MLDNGEERMQKTVVIPQGALPEYSERAKRPVNDSWCSRSAACKLRYVIETAEDLEKDYLTVTPQEIEEYDSAIRKWEQEWISAHAA